MTVVRITPQIHGLVEYLFGFFQAAYMGVYLSTTAQKGRIVSFVEQYLIDVFFGFFIIILPSIIIHQG